VAAFSPLLDLLADVPDPRRAEGKLYKLPHVLLFSILAIVAGCNSYRGIVTDTALVLAHIDIAEKSNEIPAAQTPLAELGIAQGATVTLDALHCQKTFRSRRSGQCRPNRPGQGQPADPAPADPGNRCNHGAARVCPQPRQGPQPRRTPHRHRL